MAEALGQEPTMPRRGSDDEVRHMATVATIADTTIVGDNEDQLVTMIVDNQLFGIPILQVQDIVEASKITPVPLAPSAIAGVLNLRGRIVTVVDLRKLLGNHEEVPWESQMGVTVEYKGDLYTLLVDAIGDVRTLPKRDFDKAPSTMEDNVRRLCSGIYRLRGNLLVVLDVSRILHTDVIEATPMLTVEERRSRKNMAVSGSDGGEARAHQLSALMTDLNAYESETDGVFGAASDANEDDIKTRKRAGRDRRPVAERWQEVLEEKARKSGHVSYRMREPDEETIENARDEMAGEDAEWAARVMDADHARPGGQDDAPVPDVPTDEAAPDLPPPAAPEFDDGLIPADTGEPTPRPETAPDILAELRDPETREPFMLDAVPDMPVEEPKTEAREPQEPAAVPDMPAEEPGLAAGDFPDVDAAPEMPAEEPKTVTMDPVAPAGDADMPRSPERESSGITSGWWNKLRGKTGGNTGEPETVDSPASDESPSGAKPAKKKAEAEAKPKSKGKTKAKTKAKPKAGKSAKSGGKPKSKKKT